MTTKTNNLKQRRDFRRQPAVKWAAGLLVQLSLAATVHAQSQPPILSQVVRAAAPVYNQFGQICLGNEPGREEMGLDYVRGNLVQILAAAPGDIIYPALKDGQNDPRNPLLHETYIGFGMDPLQETPGMFAASVTPRPAANTKIFVRVFNMPSRELSSFYADSSLFTVSWSVDSIFYANIPHTSNAIDPDDDDGDGLNNSWERWKGSNPGKVDTDGDGFDDMSEFLAGTDADNWDSFLHIVDMTITSNNMIRMEFVAATDRPVCVQGGDDPANFNVCTPSNMQTNPLAGIISVEVPANSSSVNVFRFGVPVNEF